MSGLFPITYIWDAEQNAMVPKQAFALLARRQFKHGAEYRLDQRQDRSSKSLAFYMATLTDIHASLPAELLEEYPTMEHLRKRALIKLGYRLEKNYVCQTVALAVNLMKILEDDDEYAVVIQKGKVVRKYTAMSQSVDGSMDRAKFEESKNRVLELAAALVGSTRKEAERNGSKGT